ncbi:MAG: sodium-dependent transporter [Gammaproteobacteria bacterium]
MDKMTQGRSDWSGRAGFLLASIGGAIGLGNLWRFPYIAGDNGGGGFVLIYLAFVFLLGVPLVAAEMLLGRRGHRSALNSISALVRSENANGGWKTIGVLSMLIPFFALSYYAVVAAWAIDYLMLSITDGFGGLDGMSSQNTFNERISRPGYQVMLHGVFIAMTVWIVANGINKGIERASKIFMPALFLVIVVLVIYGMINADFSAAVDFLFRPDFSKVTGQSYLIALGQALFSLGIGVGLMITYGSYMPKEFSLRTSVTIICIGDTLAAILAGLAIFPIVFASGLDPGEGPGLIFVSLPIAFGGMPGGQVVGALFFLLLFFAAYTSALGMLEPVVSWLEERAPGRRKQMSMIAGFAIWVIGLGPVFSFSLLSDFRPLGFIGVDKGIFGLFDYTIANVLAPFNALLIALFAGWVLQRKVVDEEFAGDSPAWKSYWRFANRYLTPAALIIVLVDLAIGWERLIPGS